MLPQPPRMRADRFSPRIWRFSISLRTKVWRRLWMLSRPGLRTALNLAKQARRKCVSIEN